MSSAFKRSICGILVGTILFCSYLLTAYWESFRSTFIFFGLPWSTLPPVELLVETIKHPVQPRPIAIGRAIQGVYDSGKANDAFEPLKSLTLPENDERIRRDAVLAISSLEVEPGRICDVLVNLLQKDHSSLVQRQVCIKLGDLALRHALPEFVPVALAERLTSTDIGLSWEAASSLSIMAKHGLPKQAIAALRQAANGDSKAVKAEVFEAIIRADAIDKHLEGRMPAMLRAMDSYSRVGILGLLAPKESYRALVVDELISVVREPASTLTTEGALEVLGAMGPSAEKAIGPIEEMLKKLRAGEFDAELDKGKIVEPTQFPVAVSLDSAEVKKRIESAAQSALQRIKGNASP